MKKLIILMLVLGLASVTNAALVLSFNGDTNVEVTTVAPSDYFTIDVYDTDGSGGEFWVNIAGPASYTGPGTVHIPPAPSNLVAANYSPGWISALMNPPSVGAIGTWWDLELHCDDEGDVVISLTDDTGYLTGTIDTITVHQIPEPMTIALLGLGGLFLRRRK